MKIGNIKHDRKNWKFGEKKSFTDDKFWKFGEKIIYR
jgi:hypothetical protein